MKTKSYISYQWVGILDGTPALNRPIQFQVYRDADAGGDTLATDARLLGVEILFN